MPHRLLIGDAASTLAELPSNSVQLVVTSPPYWKIKDYEHPRQIGHQQSYEEYLSRLYEVWRESARVLSKGCRIAINVGDQFLRACENVEYSVAPIHADVIRQVAAIPEIVYLGSIIWRKISTTKTTGGGCWMGSVYHPRDGYVTYEHEYILLFKKRGRLKTPSSEAKEKSRLTKEQRSLWFRGIWELRPVRQEKHCAMFPVDLPERLIRMFTFAGETVLDPFVGSGTTLEAAERAGRFGIGVEINKRFVPATQQRLPAERLTILEAGDNGRKEGEPSQPRLQSAQPQPGAEPRRPHDGDLGIAAVR